MTGADTQTSAFTGRPRIDVVVRTLALKEREQALLHALDTIQAITAFDARPIVIVNGDRYDRPLYAALQKREGILLHYLPTASAGLALTEGRRLVTAPAFTFLDDDDELLATGFEAVAQYMSSNDDWDVIVTNGYFSSNGKHTPMYLDLPSFTTHPLRSLIQEGWLCPGASMFRTESVPVRLLGAGRDNQEWTYIAYRLLMADKRIRFLDVPTVTYNDTAVSASKGIAHQEAALRLFGEMKADSRVDKQTRSAMAVKYRNLQHVLAAAYMRKGDHRRAWGYHVRSLQPPSTFKYLLFSRKLLVAALKPRRLSGRNKPHP